VHITVADQDAVGQAADKLDDARIIGLGGSFGRLGILLMP
jgi:hypothetical protein